MKCQVSLRSPALFCTAFVNLLRMILVFPLDSEVTMIIISTPVFYWILIYTHLLYVVHVCFTGVSFRCSRQPLVLHFHWGFCLGPQLGPCSPSWAAPVKHNHTRHSSIRPCSRYAWLPVTFSWSTLSFQKPYQVIVE